MKQQDKSVVGETAVCPFCRNVIPGTSKFCPKCGNLLSLTKPILVNQIERKDEKPKKEEVPVLETEQEKENVKTEVNQISDDQPSKKPVLPLILGILFSAAVIGFIVLKPYFNRNSIHAEETLDSQNQELSAEEESGTPMEGEEAAEVSIPEETSVKLIDLTDSLNNINELHSILHGIERTSSGSYEHWYQDINDKFGYGNYPDDSHVGEFWIRSDGYSVYNVQISQDLEDAANILSDQDWLLDDVIGDTYDFRKGTDLLSLQLNKDKQVSSVSVLRNFYHVEETPKPTIEASKDDSYFFPNSLDELLDESQLYGMTARELTLARNEVYARYGYTFKRQDLQEYFNTKSWYHADPSVNSNTIGSIVSATGMKNMVMIREYQKRTGLTY